ncbi:hypothetical protein D9619_004279 [Psilocybe cf. subviscida]|uniref:Poly [ADP-ribose] polymerase n=1 Tax=Psilocybe cf. subviscida TaxID=2480587 RepID=A0A8H5BNX6_9AGAR|nr:hypothetical protein D9619_004279 [Psilocybe cf. subviscida]
MSTAIDEFSFDHPDNHGFSKFNRLRRLTSKDSHFSDIEKLFYKGWKHPNKSKPQIQAIYKILATESSLNPASVLTSPALRGRRKNPVNEQFLFHGTNRYCRLAEDAGRLRLCLLSKCHLCNIIRNSFDVGKCGKKHKFRRFGKGIYTSACSSKSDDYTLNGDEGSNLRVLLVTRVVVGNPHRLQENATSLLEPPTGYHSVIGEPGIDLNYEETVVYDNDAIRPAFLVVYGDAPPAKPKLQSLIATLFKTPLAA